MCVSTCGICTWVFICAIFIVKFLGALVPYHFWCICKAVCMSMARARPKAETSQTQRGNPWLKEKAGWITKHLVQPKTPLPKYGREQVPPVTEGSPLAQLCGLEQLRDRKPHLPSYWPLSVKNPIILFSVILWRNCLVIQLNMVPLSPWRSKLRAFEVTNGFREMALKTLHPKYESREQLSTSLSHLSPQCNREQGYLYDDIAIRGSEQLASWFMLL